MTHIIRVNATELQVLSDENKLPTRVDKMHIYKSFHINYIIRFQENKMYSLNFVAFCAKFHKNETALDGHQIENQLSVLLLGNKS